LEGETFADCFACAKTDMIVRHYFENNNLICVIIYCKMNDILYAAELSLLANHTIVRKIGVMEDRIVISGFPITPQNIKDKLSLILNFQ